MLFAKLNRRTKIILMLQSIGMLIGTTTHLVWIINNGFLSNKYNAPLISKLFWDSLIFLDPLAVVLLLLKPKKGIWITFFIIITDVLHNGTFALLFSKKNSNYTFNNFDWIGHNWILICQIVFGLFVLSSLQNNLKEVNRLINI